MPKITCQFNRVFTEALKILVVPNLFGRKEEIDKKSKRDVTLYKSSRVTKKGLQGHKSTLNHKKISQHFFIHLNNMQV